MPSYEVPCTECCCTSCTGTGTPGDGTYPCCEWWGIANLYLRWEDFTYGDFWYGDVCIPLAGNGCGRFTFSGSTVLQNGVPAFVAQDGVPGSVPPLEISYFCAVTEGGEKTWHARVKVGDAPVVEFAQDESCGLCANMAFNPVEWIEPDVYGPGYFASNYNHSSGDTIWSVGSATLNTSPCDECEGCEPEYLDCNEELNSCSECCEGSRGVPEFAEWSGQSGPPTGSLVACEWTWTSPNATLVLSPTRVATLTVNGVGVYSATLPDCCTQFTGEQVRADDGYFPLPLVTAIGVDPPATQGIRTICCILEGPLPEVVGADCNPTTGHCVSVFAPNTPAYETKAECEANCLQHGYACLPLTGCTEGDYDPDTTDVYGDIVSCRNAGCTVEGWRCVDDGGVNVCTYDAAWPDDGSTTHATEGGCQAACENHGWQCVDGACVEGDYTIASGTTHPAPGGCIVACCAAEYTITVGPGACPDAVGTWTVAAAADYWEGPAGGGSTIGIRVATGACLAGGAGYEAYWTDGVDFVTWCLGEWNPGGTGCGGCVDAPPGDSVGCSPGGDAEVCPVPPPPMAPMTAAAPPDVTPDAPAPPPEPPTAARGLGDMVAAGLSAVGVTKERVAKLTGRKKCGCAERQAKLNEWGKKFGIGVTPNDAAGSGA